MIDSKTISAVMQGDSQAFETVYLQTHDKAYSIAYRVLKDDYEAEDIVQDAYLKMIEQVGQLQNPERFESWFYRIVQNKALDYLRTNHSDTFSSFESEENDFSFSDTLVSDYTPFDPEASADYAELKRLMDGFVSELPEMQRKCILLRFKHDKKISEIAQLLGIPESTVKSNLNYGKKKIEGEVRALEKQGVKLYSLSPLTVIPFLRWMWGKSAASAFFVGVGSAGAAAGAMATVTASTAAGAAVKTGIAIGIKQMIAAVCAVAVIGGGTVAAVHAAKPPVTVPTETIAEMSEPTEETGETQAEETAPEETQVEETTPKETEETEESEETTAPASPAAPVPHASPDGGAPSTEPTEAETEPTEAETEPSGPVLILSVGHIHAKWKDEALATCEHGGHVRVYCECGEVYEEYDTPALGHNYVTSGSTHTCTRCGSSYQDPEPTEETTKPPAGYGTYEIVSPPKPTVPANIADIIGAVDNAASGTPSSGGQSEQIATPAPSYYPVHTNPAPTYPVPDAEDLSLCD